jgi:hypothetical protein
MKVKLIFIFIVLILSACRTSIEEISEIDPNYSIADVNSFMVSLDCGDVDVTELEEDFIKMYCDLLRTHISTKIQQQHPDWELVDEEADLFIEASLEQLYGGNEALRFFPSFQAGRSMITIQFYVYKNELLIAERRLTETTSRIHFEKRQYTNEDAITADSIIMAGYVSDYIDNPEKFDTGLKDYRNDYVPNY